MIKIGFAPQFLKKFSHLDIDLRGEVKEKVQLLKDKTKHARLKVHKLHGDLSGRYAFSVNYKIRVVFRYENKRLITCLTIGTHDEVY